MGWRKIISWQLKGRVLLRTNLRRAISSYLKMWQENDMENAADVRITMKII